MQVCSPHSFPRDERLLHVKQSPTAGAVQRPCCCARRLESASQQHEPMVGSGDAPWMYLRRARGRRRAFG